MDRDKTGRLSSSCVFHRTDHRLEIVVQTLCKNWPIFSIGTIRLLSEGAVSLVTKSTSVFCFDRGAQRVSARSGHDVVRYLVTLPSDGRVWSAKLAKTWVL